MLPITYNNSDIARLTSVQSFSAHTYSNLLWQDNAWESNFAFRVVCSKNNILRFCMQVVNLWSVDYSSCWSPFYKKRGHSSFSLSFRRNMLECIYVQFYALSCRMIDHVSGDSSWSPQHDDLDPCTIYLSSKSLSNYDNFLISSLDIDISHTTGDVCFKFQDYHIIECITIPLRWWFVSRRSAHDVISFLANLILPQQWTKYCVLE